MRDTRQTCGHVRIVPRKTTTNNRKKKLEPRIIELMETAHERGVQCYVRTVYCIVHCCFIFLKYATAPMMSKTNQRGEKRERTPLNSTQCTPAWALISAHTVHPRKISQTHSDAASNPYQSPNMSITNGILVTPRLERYQTFQTVPFHTNTYCLCTLANGANMPCSKRIVLN